MNKPVTFFLLGNDQVCLSGAEISDTVKFVTVGSPNFLHVATLLMKRAEVSEIIVLDINPSQIHHAQRQLDALQASNSRVDFVERLLCLEIDSVGRRYLQRFAGHGSLDCIPGIQFTDDSWELEKKLWQHIRLNSERFLRLYGLRGKTGIAGIEVRSELFGKPCVQHAQILACRWLRNGVVPVTLSFGWGFLRNEEDFGRLRSLLASRPIHFVCADMFQGGKLLLNLLKESNVIFFCSNIFSPDSVSSGNRMPFRVFSQDVEDGSGTARVEFLFATEDRNKQATLKSSVAHSNRTFEPAQPNGSSARRSAGAQP